MNPCALSSCNNNLSSLLSRKVGSYPPSSSFSRRGLRSLSFASVGGPCSFITPSSRTSNKKTTSAMAHQQQQQRCLHHEEIIKLENWPPRSGKPYDWTIPTNEAYKNQAEDELEKAAAASNPTEGASRRRPQHNFTLPFQLARSNLDYAYHKNPQVIRQELQDELLSNILHATSVASSSMGIKEQIKVDKTKHVEENRRKLP